MSNKAETTDVMIDSSDCKGLSFLAIFSKKDEDMKLMSEVKDRYG